MEPTFSTNFFESADMTFFSCLNFGIHVGLSLANTLHIFFLRVYEDKRIDKQKASK